MTHALTTRRSVLFAGLVLPLIGMPAVPERLPQRQVRVSAPFDMPAIAIPDFSSAPRYAITDFGAVRGDPTRTGDAIAMAIAAANAAGGGVVVVPEGVWDTGKIHLRSNVNLHLAKGATLLFSDKPEDYLPAVSSSWEGVECYNYSPLVYAYDCENVALTGEGKLQAKLGTWRDWNQRTREHYDALIAIYDMASNNVPVHQRQMARPEYRLRPHFVQFNRCRHVLVEDVTIEDSPFWCMHPLLCRDVVIRRLQVKALGFNNDGCDPEMSQNVLIEDCVFDAGDDALSVKAGRDMDAWRLNTPARNIVMRNCRIQNGHQILAIGSELSGGVENVFVDNCQFDSSESRSPNMLSNVLYVKTNERRGGYVKNIHVSNIVANQLHGGVLSVDTDVLYQWRTLMPTYVRKLTPIEGLHVSNIHVNEARYLTYFNADKELPVRNVTMDKVNVETVLGTPWQKNI